MRGDNFRRNHGSGLREALYWQIQWASGCFNLKPRYGRMKDGSPNPFRWHVALGTVSFTLCFAAWGLMSAFAPQFRKLFDLTPTQSAALVATPVLLGGLARLPAGMLTD